MPCGGIYPAGGRERFPYLCFHCNQPGPDCWVEEWDAPIHSECVKDFLETEEGSFIIGHGHYIGIWTEVVDADGDQKDVIEDIWFEVSEEDKKMFTQGTSFTIESDGNTVWVNRPLGNIARFSSRGIDIHEPPEKELGDKGVCLFCKPGFLKKEDWVLFKDKMREHYEITIGDEHTPLRYR